ALSRQPLHALVEALQSRRFEVAAFARFRRRRIRDEGLDAGLERLSNLDVLRDRGAVLDRAIDATDEGVRCSLGREVLVEVDALFRAPYLDAEIDLPVLGDTLRFSHVDPHAIGFG